ncbi:MAG: UDP-2,3-diacylglucosamine diphosphatase [Betaproteobacteria bacterium]
MELIAPPHWRYVDFISDLHIDAQTPLTLATLRRYLESTPAQAVCVLGDLFEVWVGDDTLGSDGGVEATVADLFYQASKRLAVYIMCGNRDFLMGSGLLRACGAQRLGDPCLLVAGTQRWLLTHGDALCLADTDYLAFRQRVRSEPWQTAFLAQTLAQRQSAAHAMRTQSEAKKRQQAQSHVEWIDLDASACLAALQDANAKHMVHGHTHQPAQHDLGGGHSRWVLSDWDLHATPPRAQALRLSVDTGGVERVDALHPFSPSA